MVQRLGLRASTAGDMGWIPGQGAKISHAMWQGQKEKKKELIELCRKKKEKWE